MARVVPAEDRSCVAEAASVLRQSGLVCLPTDTVYGLAAVAGDDGAVTTLYAVKGRAPDKPLPVFLADASELPRVCTDIPPLAWRLADAFWPGGLTLVLPRSPAFHSLALAGDATVAVRVPNHHLVLAIVRTLGEPITGTSANLSGRPSPATAEEASEQVGEMVDLIVDGGRCGGVESTIVDLTRPKPVLLRVGAVSTVELERVIGAKVWA